MSKPTLRIHTHWQVAQSHPANQNLPKSMAAPTHGRQESAAKLIVKNDKNKNGQLLTSGHKTLGVKWLIKHSTSHQGSVSGVTFAAPKSPTFHTADRFILIGSLLTFNSLPLLSQEKVGQNRPNIVFILADDMGWKDLGCYGNPYNETPNLDQLAKSGIRFTQAYAACPVCSPTRASIMTGKYPARLKLTNFIGGVRTDPQSPVLPAKWNQYMEARESTLPELLKQKGYTTGMVGKWHLGNHDSIAPWNQGFDYSRMITKNGLDYYNYSIRCFPSHFVQLTMSDEQANVSKAPGCQKAPK